jgi:fructose-1,6-bisphosphatase I
MADRASEATMTDITLRLAQHLRGGEAELGRIVEHIALAGKIIAREISRARLIGRLGTTGAVNIQGEVVKTLDAWSNDVMVQALTASGRVCTMISEEMAEPLHLTDRCEGGRYVVCFDPVDGSSNLDVNGVVGTIFSIRHRLGDGPDHLNTDTQQPGSAQVAAGYIMYGPSTVLVYTGGDGVAGFTLDGTIGEFIRWSSRLEIPARGHIYSVNDAHAPAWAPGVRRYIQHLRERDVATGRPYSARYAGSMVADVHHTLLEGGIYLYPAETGADGNAAAGKLRLQYEAAPMAFVIEQAGGMASTGHERIPDIRPTSVHQRVPVLIGSRDDVALAEDVVTGRSPKVVT